MLVKDLIEKLQKADPFATIYIVSPDENIVNDGAEIDQTLEITNSINADGFYIITTE